MVEIRRALELDPHNPLWQLNNGLALLSLGHDDDAMAMSQKRLETNPDFTLTRSFLWDVFHKKGMYEEAFSEARMFHAGRGDDEAAESLARGHTEGGYQRAMHVAAEMMAARFTRRYVHPTAIARLYAYAGEKDRALEWLERAYQERDSQLMYLQWHVEWDSLRPDPRFENLFRRMNFPM
jgi:tetratricopeptide (TPR) repeat protein